MRRSLDLGGLRGRDELNSSFYAVIRFDNLDTSVCARILETRGWRLNLEVTELLVIASGGLPRDLVRLASVLQDSASSLDHELTALDAFSMLSSELCRAFHDEWVMGPISRGIEEVRMPEVLKRLSDLSSAKPEEIIHSFGTSWEFIESDAGAPGAKEEWRRLLCQLRALAGYWCARQTQLGSDNIDRFRAAVAASSRSAASARLVLQDNEYAKFIAESDN